MTPLPAIDPADLPELRPAVLASQEEYDEFVRSMPDHGTPADWNWALATGWEPGGHVTTADVRAGACGVRRGRTEWRRDPASNLVRLPAGQVGGTIRWLYLMFDDPDVGGGCQALFASSGQAALPILDDPTRGQVRALMDVLGA